MSTESKFSIKEFFLFIFSKTFIKHILLIILFFVLIIVGLLFWLDSYTHHGQKLTLPDYTEMDVEKAKQEAEKSKFHIIVDDSTHIVGKRGGLIISQNPIPNSKVKENRKVYVTITKFNADKIKLEDLPELYGYNYKSKKRELSFMKINSVIKGYKYDKNTPDNILEAYYNGKLITGEQKPKGVEIEKGGTIEFILSSRTGGTTNLPDLRCKSFEQAEFLIESRNLKLGKVMKNGILTDDYTGYVISHEPTASDDIPMGTSVDINLVDELPPGCH